MKTIYEFIIKELLQFKRDKKMISVVFIAPVFQIILLGYAVNMDVEVVHTTIFDQDKSESSREFIRNFEESGYFSIDYYVSSYNEVTELIDQGKTLAAIIIPKDFEKKLNRRETISIQTLFEGSDGNKSAISLGYIQGIMNRYSQDIINQAKDKYGMKLPLSGSLIPEVRVWYNAEMTTRNYMIPGVFGLTIMITTLSLMSMAVVKEREIGTLEQLVVTPIKSYQLILGKLIPFTILGFILMILIMLIMILWFGIPIRGSVIFLLFTALLFVLSNLGWGLLISTISKTQGQAMMISVLAVMMPMIYLSGFAFPIENMPQLVQYITYLIPLRYFNTILRGIVLKGIGFSALWQETIILFVMGVLILSLSVLWFNKKME